MMRTSQRRAFVGVLLAGLLLLVIGQPEAGASQRARCSEKGSVTFARSSTTRIFASSGSEVFGCLYRRGVPVPLDIFDDVSPGLNHISLAGPYVGYETTSSSSSGSSSGIRVFNLRTGRRERALTRTLSGGFVGGPSPGESSDFLRDLTVTPRGRVAWIDEVVPYVRCPTPLPSTCAERQRTEVRLLGPDGYRVLDSGTGIAPTSLHRRGTRIYWRRDGQRRSTRVG